MAIIARLVGEGIGPFKSFDFDFSDVHGNPYTGPHVFAGVNGSGKSTILRTLAWLLEDERSGFQWQQWRHLTQGHSSTRAMIVGSFPSGEPFAYAQTFDTSNSWKDSLLHWAKSLLSSGKIESLKGEVRNEAFKKPGIDEGRLSCNTIWIGKEDKIPGYPVYAAYGPSRLLKHLPEVNLSAHLNNSREDALSFEATVKNEAIQSWLLGLFSKRAIAKERGENMSKYSAALARFETALKLISGQDMQFTVDIEPSLQPRLLIYHKKLDFSQIPDGVRSTVGWLADFLMRMDIEKWPHDSDPIGLLLLDEIDAHLHPKWQRLILPAIKQALPEVQVFATSHSPFVISSCPGSRIHVLELDADGQARNRPAEDAPVGESILGTIKDIFGVSSRFDIETEKLLEEWNELRRSQVASTLSSEEKGRLATLTQDLSSRSEELRQIVTPVVPISDSLVHSLQSQAERSTQRPARRKARN